MCIRDRDESAVVLHHVAGGSLRDVKDTRQVHGEHPAPFVGRDIEKLMTNTDTGVVDDDVQSAKIAHYGCEGELHLPVIGDIGKESSRDASLFGADLFARGSIAVKDSHCRTLLQEPRSRGRTDAAGASGDDDTLTFESPHRPLDWRGRSPPH